MNFRIADTFTDSLSKLTGEEQKAVKTTAFDLQMNPANPGMKFHKLDKARDKHFWSVRVSSDLRLITHKTPNSLLLCYVDHHDNAYRWAERRKLETHPMTGAAQLVEIREIIKNITIPKYVEVEQPVPPKPALFSCVAEEQLLSYGVPTEWLDDVRLADEDSLLDLADHLPSEAAEALLELATGGTPQITPVPETTVDPFDHPDAQRRFRVMANMDELERALEFPWGKWMVFLHPAQRQLVEHDYNGPARVSGSAGTGKTVVALHRAVYLARKHPDARVLLTTFSATLAHALHVLLRRLISHEPRLAERLEVHSITDIGRRIGEAKLGKIMIAKTDQMATVIASIAKKQSELKFSPGFLLDEWLNVVDAWQLKTWDEYRDIRRLGRKTRLAETQRQILWKLFQKVRTALADQNLFTQAELFSLIAEKMQEGGHSPFDFAVIDEAQDISVPELRFLAALGGDRPNALFFAGDLGQRIFQQPFSWKALGVDIRGRSRTLRINYRTSHQIRRQADRLLPPELSDVDGNVENRKGAVSIFNGPEPDIQIHENEQDEVTAVSDWLTGLHKENFQLRSMSIMVRSSGQIPRAVQAVESAGLNYEVLGEKMDAKADHVSICLMHLAKGLEFRAVAIMACDDEVIPLQERIETITDDADLEEVYNTERHLLYVACTRARDRLLITAMAPASEFLDDLQGN